mmetsp:Transcript_8754/g.12747  ORF Transcript_8754/g.12747 Transcript_8754/m.12747 type:complete len:108 (+) Transcript_8754:3308-3631(+)
MLTAIVNGARADRPDKSIYNPAGGASPFLLQALGTLEEKSGHLVEAELLYVAAVNAEGASSDALLLQHWQDMLLLNKMKTNQYQRIYSQQLSHKGNKTIEMEQRTRL